MMKLMPEIDEVCFKAMKTSTEHEILKTSNYNSLWRLHNQ